MTPFESRAFDISGLALGDSLDTLHAMNPECTWKVIDGVVNVRVGSGTESLLEARVGAFSYDDDATSFFIPARPPSRARRICSPRMPDRWMEHSAHAEGPSESTAPTSLWA